MYSQRDASWRRQRLGTGPTTIGSEGCLLCCVAEILRETPNPLTPAELNTWLVAHNGYVMGNRLLFAAVEPLGLRFVGYYDARSRPMPIEKLRGWLDNGFRVILEIDYGRVRRGVYHWVLLRALQGHDAIVEDPLLPPDRQFPVKLLERYAMPHWGLERLITRGVAYQITHKGEEHA